MNPAALAFASPAFNGFKNNDYQATSISVSGTITGSGSGSFTSSVSLQRDESVARIFLTTNRTSTSSGYSSGNTYELPGRIDYSDGTTTGFPGNAAYSVFFQLNFVVNQLTITAFIPNPYSTTLSGIGATYNFQIFTFVAPFVS